MDFVNLSLWTKSSHSIPAITSPLAVSPRCRDVTTSTPRSVRHARLTTSAKHVPKQPVQEVLEPRPKYNDPEINPQEFLLAVMRDERLPMQARIQAAKDVAVYVHARLAQVTQDVTAGIQIHITGGLPELPGTNIIMPETATKKGNGRDPDAG